MKSTLDFDAIYYDMFLKIKNEGQWSSDKVRTKYADGTPARRKQIFGYSFRFDNSTDVVPLVTSRQIPVKSAIAEMYWIWIMQSNDVDELNKLKCKFWDEWAKLDTENRSIVYIEPVKVTKPNGFKVIKVNEIVDENCKLHTSNQYGDFYLLEKDKKTQKCKIQFKDTGHIKTVTYSALYYGEVRDEYKRIVNRIGYYADYMNAEILEYFGKYHRRWVTTWENMVRRTSGTYSGNKAWYEGVFVSENFTCCEYFLRWVMKNNRYGKEYLHTLQLDKDYYGAKCYSEDSCVLLTPKENSALTLKKWYKYKDVYCFSCSDLAAQFSDDFVNQNFYKPNGEYSPYKVKGLVNELIKTGLVSVIENKETNGMLPRFPLKPKRTILKSYGFQIAKPTFGHKSQLHYVIHELKNNPDSTRIITNLWDVSNLHIMALTPCVYETQWSVADGKVVLEVGVRSNDFALGLPNNVFQYAILHRLVAKEVGLPCGDMIYRIHNLHYYDRHEEGLEKQFADFDKVELIGYPKIGKLSNKSIFDFKPNEGNIFYRFSLNASPKINYEIAI